LEYSDRLLSGTVSRTSLQGNFLVTLHGLGLQVEEISGPDQTIAPLGCAHAAFVGRTLRGPVNRPVLLTSFAEFQHIFGGLWQPSPLGYAVEHFFDNGGREAFVVRVVNGARSSSMTLRADTQVLKLRAVRPGTREFLRASVDYDNIPTADTSEFNLTVQRVRTPGTEQVEDQEIFPRLSVLPDHERYVGNAFSASELIRLDGGVPSQRPDRTLDSTSGLATGYIVSNADGDDGAPLTDYDLIGSKIDETGLFALDGVENFNLLCIPPLSRDQDVGPGVLLVAARYCKSRRALFVVDPPSQWLTADDALRELKRWEFANENALMYFPRILAHDKLRGHFESFAPCGAVAGILARSDETCPVWGPAKIDDAILRTGFRPSCLVTEDKRMRLASLGVNTIQAGRSAARIGVQPRTLAAGSAGTADWQSLAARRLALFIVNSIERGTRWVVHTRPHRDVTEQAAAQVRAFFEFLHDAGAFGTRTMEESFFVICDQRVNSVESAPAGDFQMVIGFAAARRREYHSFRVSHSASGSKVSPVSLNRLNRAQYSPEELDWVDNIANQLRP
jgi:phage tail sheath protein FI